MELWSSGDRDTAVQTVVKLCDAGAKTEQLRPYTMTEAEFVALPIDEQQERKMEIVKDLETLREITRELARRSEAAAAAGDLASAEAHLRVNKRIGEANTGPDVMLIVNLLGEAITKRADSDLAAIQAKP